MEFVIKGIRLFYSIYALIIFLILMLVVLPFVLLFSLFGNETGGNLVYRCCNVWARIWYGCTGIHHSEIYEAPINRRSHYIFVANHSSYLDIPAVVRSIRQPVRVLGKYEMVKYPVFGLIYRAAVILVDRTSAEKRSKSVRAMRKALEKNISIFIFPEGTFNETDQPLKSFYDGAFRLAIETQTAIKPLVFVDTIERLPPDQFLQLTPGRSLVVFLKDVSVKGYSLKETDLLKNEVHDLMSKAILEYRSKK